MTTPQDRQDEQWLEALAGRPDPHAPPWLNKQASLLRKALAAQKSEIDRRTPKADEALYQQLLFRFRREGLLRTTAIPQQPRFRALAASVLRWGGLAGAATLSWNPRYLALAASVLLAVGIVFHGGLFNPQAEEDFLVLKGGQMVTRGGERAIVQVVTDPNARLAELRSGLNAAGVQPKVSKDKSGRVRIAATRLDAVVDYLNEQRLGPIPAEPEVVIILEKAPPSGK